VIGGSEATAQTIAPATAEGLPWLALIAVFDAIFLAIGIAIFDYVFDV
jgi:hypothetical protein